MIEIPEALHLAKQINEALIGKKITGAVTESSPHKFAWYHGDPKVYDTILKGKVIEGAAAWGGLLEIKAGQAYILFGDGVNLRYHSGEEYLPSKHQLLITFDDGSALSASVQMYGGLWCYQEGEFNNPYFLIAKQKPSPLSNCFDYDYFMQIIEAAPTRTITVKALLATEQRIPGLGNGVLQDILWQSGLNPRRKLNTLSEEEKNKLFCTLKAVLAKMAELGGRNTERDLYGSPGGYKTVMSKNNTDAVCPICTIEIVKENYMGGSVYYCPSCQHM